MSKMRRTGWTACSVVLVEATRIRATSGGLVDRNPPHLEAQPGRHEDPRGISQLPDVLQDLPPAGAAGNRADRRGGRASGARRPADRSPGRAGEQLRAAAPASGSRTRSLSRATIWPTCPKWSSWPSGGEAAARRRSSSPAAIARRSSRAICSSTPRGDRLRVQGRGRGLGCAAAGGGREPDARALLEVPGVVTAQGAGPAAWLHQEPRRSGRRARPACGIAASISSACSIPCASIEFTRGCPWDCSFCSAWTFYGRSYRVKSAEAAARRAGADPRARRLHRR